MIKARKDFWTVVALEFLERRNSVLVIRWQLCGKWRPWLGNFSCFDHIVHCFCQMPLIWGVGMLMRLWGAQNSLKQPLALPLEFRLNLSPSMYFTNGKTETQTQCSLIFWFSAQCFCHPSVAPFIPGLHAAGARQSHSDWFHSWLYHLLAVDLGRGYLRSLCLSFLSWTILSGLPWRFGNEV